MNPGALVRRPLTVLVGGMLLGTIACGGQVASAPTPTPLEDCRGNATSSASAQTPGVTYPNLTVDGRQRDYRLFEPQSADSATPVSLVVVIPPPQVDADLFESLIHFDTEASTAGFVSASPNGCESSWSYSPGAENLADEDFMGKMIDQLRGRFHISAVYAVSASGGSRMLYRLACDLANDLTAVADVAGTMILKDDCKPAHPISILEIHGTSDDASPWQGGGPNGSYPVEDVNQRWRMLDGCVGDPAVKQTGITVTSAWTQCNGGSVVRLDKVVGGRHTWFGSGDADAVSGEPKANSVIWSFFSSLTAA
jgi:polyhydroxybutyrate depolymerase